MQTLDAKTVPLDGINLIEASAGTGKTWTISWLYLRLVAVYGMKVDSILVVTYTDAATSELRDRVRRRLADALAFLEGRPHEETYETLLDADDKAVAIRRLQLALVSFDEAAVFTIHGFCKRVLTENAFEARLPFESELVANEDSLLTELADEFWYQHFFRPDNTHLTLLQQGLTPDGLLEDVRSFIGKPYLSENIQPLDPQAFTQVTDAFDAAVGACRECWLAERDAIIKLMLSGALHGQSYRKDYMSKRAATLDAVLGADKRVVNTETLRWFTTQQLAEKTKKGKTAPQHRFFQLADRLLETGEALLAAQGGALESLRLKLLHYLRRELPGRKQQLGMLTFDDLLLNLRDALEQHAGLAARLADKYQAALIDEFQDTDPIQYNIFERIYRHSETPRVFYVGDPKQAIYGFRGADIHTYLQAANSTELRHTLKYNYRSHPDLLRALNHLFSQSADPFRSQIRYEAVEAGRGQDDLVVAGGLPAVRLWDWDYLDDGYTVSAIQDAMAAAVADDIARLLNAARNGRARIGGRPLQSRDIAVLVRENRQGDLIKQALLARGIVSVQQTRESVFATREADELRSLLRAVADPGSESSLRQALATELCGYTASGLLALDDDPERLERCFEQFHHWHQIWRKQGFMPMFRHLLLQNAVYERLLGMADGERRLTNLLHLAELVHTETRLHGHGMYALIRWLQKMAQDNGETAQLRLESDENLVQIVTIHKSKGLEYGIVYCPFLWKESIRSRTWFSWHDEKSGRSCLQARSLADDEQTARFLRAEEAESLRLLYVALTRAKYHCTITLASGQVKTGGSAPFSYYSALTWLLFGDLPQAGEILSLPKAMQPEERQLLMRTRLREIAATADNLLMYAALPSAGAPVFYRNEEQQGEYRVRTYDHRLPPSPRVGSFSGLIAGQDDEQPDYDMLAWSPVAEVAPVTAESGAAVRFPRGAQAGSCLHKMLECLDFTLPVSGQHDEVLKPALQRHGMAEQWLEAAECLLENTLHTPLDAASGMRLADLPKTRRLDELEFYFPVDALQTPALQKLLHQHLPGEWREIHAAIDRLNFSILNGFMKGFIDLIFEHDGRYYVVDYKSNDLGETSQAYSQAAMRQAMAEHHYYLQYLIYCLALHRYLRQRIADYAWETHAGGAMYLFLRGMQPEAAGSGVFAHKPEAALIEALDALMTGEKVSPEQQAALERLRKRSYPLGGKGVSRDELYE